MESGPPLPGGGPFHFNRARFLGQRIDFTGTRSFVC